MTRSLSSTQERPSSYGLDAKLHFEIIPILAVVVAYVQRCCLFCSRRLAEYRWWRESDLWTELNAIG